jgi:hypothetical protein
VLLPTCLISSELWIFLNYKTNHVGELVFFLPL